ncbi:MAG: hypothetical protein ONB30_13275 [candidate division KSB1 bacterium]|nr:hypothetical protein [candidate division KSB1 bacterium]
MVRTVGDSEFPSPGEPVFARPAGVVVDGNGRVFVPDPEQHQVFVLSPEGDLVRAIGGPGRGPGEMGNPMGVGIGAGGEVIVAEGCCRLHEFTAELDYVRSLTWPVEVLPLGGKAFVVIGALALVPLPPLPPARTNVMHLFALDGPEPLPVGSFLPYAKPQRSFREASLQQSAVSSRNIVVLGTDANRYVALARAAEAEIIVWDLILGLARRYELRGQAIETRPSGDAPGPAFAVVQVVKDLAFGGQSALYALVRRYGLLEVPIEMPECAVLYRSDGVEEIDAELGNYWAMAVARGRGYLLSPPIGAAGHLLARAALWAGIYP